MCAKETQSCGEGDTDESLPYVCKLLRYIIVINLNLNCLTLSLYDIRMILNYNFLTEISPIQIKNEDFEFVNYGKKESIYRKKDTL